MQREVKVMIPGEFEAQGEKGQPWGAKRSPRAPSKDDEQSEPRPPQRHPRALSL